MGPQGLKAVLKDTSPLLLVSQPWAPRRLWGCQVGSGGPGPISPDLINRPFIFVLKESAIFCLFN